MDKFISGDVPKLEGDEAKDAHKRSMAKAKIIIAYLIKDHLIPHVSAFKTPKEVYDALTKMFEGKNINRKNDFEEPTEECEDTELRDYTFLLH